MLKFSCRVMNVVFIVLIKIEILTRGTFSSIAIELENDGQRALSDQELDVKHMYMYAVLKCIAFQLT